MDLRIEEKSTGGGGLCDETHFVFLSCRLVCRLNGLVVYCDDDDDHDDDALYVTKPFYL